MAVPNLFTLLYRPDTLSVVPNRSNVIETHEHKGDIRPGSDGCGREEKLEPIPAAATDDGAVGDIARAILIVVTVEQELALLVDSVDDAIAP